MLHHVLTLARVSNLPTVWSNCLAAWLISGTQPSWHMLWLLAGASLLYAAGCTLNDAFDVNWDTQHRPERLIPSGKLSRPVVWLIGLTEMAAGLALIFAGSVSLWWPPVALAAAILLYDAWHKQSPLSVIIMGACRWLLYVTAAAAAGGNLAPQAELGAPGGHLSSPIILGSVLWLYIIVLSLVARGEAKRTTATPRTRQLLLTVPLAVAAAAIVNNSSATEWWAPALIAYAGIGMLTPAKDAPVGTWVNRLLAAIPVVDLSLVLTIWSRGVDAFSLWVLAFPVAVALSLLFQRWFRAT